MVHRYHSLNCSCFTVINALSRNSLYILSFNDLYIDDCVKFEEGVVSSLTTIDERKYNYVEHSYQNGNFVQFCGITKNLDRYLLRFRVNERFYCARVIFVDLETQKILVESTLDVYLQRGYQNISLNWNMDEIGFVYFDDGILHFKYSKSYSSFEKSSLKHISRLSVLTSFSSEYLSKQNLPKSLIEYLGLELIRKRPADSVSEALKVNN